MKHTVKWKNGAYRIQYLVRIFLCLSFTMLSWGCLAAAIDASSPLAHPKPVVVSGGRCSYNFSDSYYNAQSLTPPSVPAQGANWNASFFGSPIILQFGSSAPSSGTTPLPCDGYYQIFFSIQLRNDTGMGAHDGMMSVAIWATSTDPSNPEVYGSAPRYYNYNNSSYSPNYGGSYIRPYAKAVFNTWSQCAWGTNYFTSSFQSCCGGYSVKGFPYFMYTGAWSVSSSSPYIYWGNVPFGPKYPYGNFCYVYDKQWGNAGYCTVSASYANTKPVQTPYCTQKPYYFKTVVYLHKGTVISPPILRGVMTQTPYQSGINNYIIGGMSVVGGNFTVTYLHP